MANGKFISYLRVSTTRQGQSGLGLEAQRESIGQYLNGGHWSLIAEVVEIESGKRNDRPKLAEALAACRLHGAVLLIAKLDRLARNAAFLLNLRDAGVEFVAVDMPNANRLTVGIMALVAEDEAERISARTKAALAAAKARGTKLGGIRTGALPNADEGRTKGRAVRTANATARASDLLPLINGIRAVGVTSLRAIAAELNARSIPTARGGAWSAVQVQRVIDRPAA